MQTRVLIVEDESIVALDLEQRLTTMGFLVVGESGTGEGAIQKAAETSPDVVLMDIQLRGEIDGIRAAERIQHDYDVPVIFVTAFSDAESLERAKRSQAYGYLLKPFHERELSIAIELALYKHAAEQEMGRSRALLDVTLNSIAEAVITTDRDDRIILMNEAAERFSGWSLADALGKPMDQVIRLERRPIGVERNEWTTLLGRAGTRRTVSVSRRRLEHTGSSGSAVVIVMRDVEQERAYQERLVAAKDAAEAATRAKSDFMARVSHEFRTPLNTIMGMASLASEGSDDTDVKENLRILKSAAEHLSGLVADVLDYARLDREPSAGHQELFDPVVVVERAARRHAMEAAEGGLRMATICEPSVPRNAFGDGEGLGHVLRHLLSNAIKFTREGYVVVRLTVPEPGTGLLEVEDSGPGIPAGKQETIFEGFSQLEHPATRRAGGVGLGLATVRRLVEGMGGNLAVDSEPGKGARFSVSFPLPDAGDGAEPWDDSYPVVTGVTTDDDLLYRTWKPWCRRWRIPCRIVESGELMKGGFSSELILTTQAVVDESSVSTDGPLVVSVTPIGRRRLSQESSGGHTATMWEPVPTDHIVASLTGGLFTLQDHPSATAHPPVDVTAFPGGPDADGHEDTSTKPGPLNLLIVDDDRGNLAVSHRLLEGLGHQVKTAPGGEAALGVLRHDSFDAVLLDIEMPGMDGWEVARRIRSGTAGSSVQQMILVALTGHREEDVMGRDEWRYFDAIMTKPVAVERVERTVRGAQEHRRRAGRLGVRTDGGLGRAHGENVPNDDTFRNEARLVTEIRSCILDDRFHDAQDVVRTLKKNTNRPGVAEAAFRLLLALRRTDEIAVQRLFAELEEEANA